LHLGAGFQTAEMGVDCCFQCLKSSVPIKQSYGARSNGTAAANSGTMG
jgi:hypothetical protein